MSKSLLAIVTAGLLSVSTCWAAPTVVSQGTVPTTGTSQVFRPRISGDWIMVNRTGKYNTPVLSVDMYNIKTGESFTPLGSGDLPWCEFNGKNILWVDQRNRSQIDLYDVTTKTQRSIPISHGNAYTCVPAIWDHYVTYLGAQGQAYLLDINTGLDRQISSGGKPAVPSMGGDLVVWIDTTTANAQLAAYRISTGELLDLNNDPNVKYTQPRTDGKTIVAGRSDMGVAALDVATGQWTQIKGGACFADVSGRLVTYCSGNAVYVYDLDTHTSTKVATAFNNGPSIDNGRVIWGTNDSVYYAQIAMPKPVIGSPAKD